MSDGVVVKRSAGRRMTPERQQRILDAAVDIAIDDGFPAITMQSVAKRTGFTRPVVYDCFDGPEAIIIAVLDRESETVAREITAVSEALNSSTALADKGFVQIIIDRLDVMRAQPRTWLLLSVPTEGTTETVRARMHEIRESLRQSFQYALSDAVRDMPDPPLDTEVASYLIQDIVHSFAQEMIARPEHYPIERIRGLIDTLMTNASPPS
ncbi:TetR/AcrR family transcriptional regulator [Nocardia sp. NPDC056000]|uniref:TetR/AcrR family transcriptional regulator n=1 Tax=Nocardia sp. NPDC056000 TaxID=3345674 RepID=UPI0035D9C9DD